MRSSRRRRLVATGLLGFACAIALTVSAPLSRTAASPAALPDLDQEAPTDISVRDHVVGGQHSYLLGFRSAVDNIGDGPLTVVGHRPSTSTPTMTVDQIVERPGQADEVVRDVGLMHYAISPDHQHWHYLAFERYQLQTAELRRAGSTEVLLEDQKTGFCLGDRYALPPPALPAAPPRKVYTGRCGLSDPDLLRVRAGISVGYGDAYEAYLEGQDLPLDGLPDGRYVLVHRVNVDHGLRETSYRNNAASVLLSLEWHAGRPSLQLLASCPESAACDEAPAAAPATPFGSEP